MKKRNGWFDRIASTMVVLLLLLIGQVAHSSTLAPAFKALVAPSQALAETSTAAVDQKLFFEPSDADYAKDHVAINAQQTAYQTAKEAGKWDEAYRLAVFYIGRAWVRNNEAYTLIQKAKAVSKNFRPTEEELDKIGGLLQEAKGQLKGIPDKSRYAEQRDVCAEKIKSNLDWVEFWEAR